MRAALSPRRGRPPGSVNPHPLRPERVRRALSLRGRGLSYERIGRALGISAQGVYSLLRRWAGRMEEAQL